MKYYAVTMVLIAALFGCHNSPHDIQYDLSGTWELSSIEQAPPTENQQIVLRFTEDTLVVKHVALSRMGFGERAISIDLEFERRGDTLHVTKVHAGRDTVGDTLRILEVTPTKLVLEMRKKIHVFMRIDDARLLELNAQL